MVVQKQHVDYYRKVALRKRLLDGEKSGIIYVPFIGDGDIANDLYKEMEILGADIDLQRVKTARRRLPKATIIEADCNIFPFSSEGPFDYADFDAWSEPYMAFRSFWADAKKADKLILFFTDGHRQGIMRTGWIHYPSGDKKYLSTLNDRRKLFNYYFPQVIFPWFANYIKPYSTIKKLFYLRGMMLSWGVVIKNAEKGASRQIRRSEKREIP